MTAIEQFQQPDLRRAPVSGFVDRVERPSARPSGRKILGFLFLSIVLAGIGAQLGYFGFRQFPSEWKARAEVQYKGSAWTETQNIAVKSRSITEPVALNFAVPIKEFEENLEAGLIAGTQILRIDFVSTDPSEARAIVDALSHAYILEVSEIVPVELRAALDAQLIEAQARLDAAETQLAEIAADITPAARLEQQSAQSLISSLRARINDLELRILDGDLRVLDDRENGVPFVVTEPFVLDDPVFPRPKLMAALGGVAGMILGLLALAAYWNVVAWREWTVIG